MAAARVTATQVAQLLLEDWKANGGSVFYARGIYGVPNPLTLDMGFKRTKTTYAKDEDSGKTNIECVYELATDIMPMQITLARPVGYLRLVPLKVTARWRNDFSDGTVESTDRSRVVLTTNARIDQAGG
jgi:hypothetical protein